MRTYDKKEVLSSGLHDRLALADAGYKAAHDNVSLRPCTDGLTTLADAPKNHLSLLGTVC
jgi:hypothetical protein